MKFLNHRGYALFWLLLAIFLAACAPPPGSDLAQEAAVSETESTDIESESSEDELVEETDVAVELAESVDLNGEAELEEAAASFETAADSLYEGIPTGFTEDGHPYLGNIDAPVVIEEYSDYQCPFCARFFSQTFEVIRQNEIASGQAVLIFYDFPLDFHPQARIAAAAARCAGEQSSVAYWQMHDELFETVDRWSNNNPEPVFIALAAEIGLDTDQFESCLTGTDFNPQIDADMARGFNLGISGTPSFDVNGQLLVGALPLNMFEQAIALAAEDQEIPFSEQAKAAEAQEAAGNIEIPPFEMPAPIEVADDYAYIYGEEDAPILIVEYTDYQCPFCGRHSVQTLPVIVQNLVDSGRVRYAFKDLPLDNLHPLGRASAEAARCAGEQDQFIAMHDILFTAQAEWSSAADPAGAFVSLADQIGIDSAEFESCIADTRYDDAIQAHVDEAFGLGITGTPGFLIGGYVVSGAQPYDIFDLVVTSIETETIEDLFRQAYEAQVEQYIAQQQAQQQQPAQPEMQAVDPNSVPIDEAIAIGNPNAPITIVEYTDFQCPFCGRHFAQTYPQIKENFIDTGLVRYVFKDFPLNFHPQAPLASEAARCAHEQDAFIEMHGALFERQQEWSGQNDAGTLFIGFAGDLGLDTAAFTTCLESGKYTDAVQADLQEGRSFGVTGTPSFLINGQPLVGAQPYETFERAITSLLEASQ